MSLPAVYAGKILKINLTSGTSETFETADYADLFLGGRGIASKLYWDEVPPEAAAFDEENCIIVALGPMAGLPAIGGSRWGIFAKSPFPVRDHFCYGNLGGFFGAELKFAGYDALIITGKAENPSILVIEGAQSNVPGVVGPGTEERTGNDDANDQGVRVKVNETAGAATRPPDNKTTVRSGFIGLLPADEVWGLPTDKTFEMVKEKTARFLNTGALESEAGTGRTSVRTDGTALPKIITKNKTERSQDISPKKIKVMAIGPAGENLVPIATVFADGDASCGGGMGAVMGSKNLKAVAVVRGSGGTPQLSGSARPTGVPPAHDVAQVIGPSPIHRLGTERREQLKQIEQEIRSYGRGNVKVWGLDFMAHGDNTKKYPCYGCMANCLRVKYTAGNGKSGKYMCQSRFFYMAHAWGYYGEENDTPFYANRMCDEYGIDTWEVQGIIEWLLRCHTEGVITEKESGLQLNKVGSFEFIRDLVEMVAYRRGFGELLCKGAEKASREYGRGTEKLYNRNDPYDPRYCTVNIMLLPFETREPIQQLHEAGLVLSQWSSWAKGVEEAHISSDVVRGIARRFWGSEKAGDMTTLAGKAEAAVRIQNRQMAKESAEICDWMFPIIDNPSGDGAEERVGEPSVEARLLSAALGREISEEEYYKIGERVFALQRAILLREGHKALQDDLLLREYREEPLEYHVADPDCLVPGDGGKIVSQVGNVIDMPSFLKLREEYYHLRGWDITTGLPSVSRLRALGLSDVAKDLRNRGFAVEKAKKISPVVRLGRSVEGGMMSIASAIGSVFSNRRLGGGHGPSATVATDAPSLREEDLHALMKEQQEKFTDPAIAHNFEGWNKTMLYYFPDIDKYYILPIVEGVGQEPEKVSSPPKKPDIYYEMSTETLRAMTRGEVSGFKAYQQRKLKLRASFTDMMKLQSLNKA